MRRSLALALALFAAGCGDDDEPRSVPLPREGPEPEQAPPAPRPTLAAPKMSAGAGAFDLVIAGDEVLWVIGLPARSGGGIEVGSLDALGVAAGDWRTAVPGRSDGTGLAPAAVEIDAQVVQGRMGIGWVERQGLQLQTRAVLGDARGRTFGGPRDLAEREHDPRSGSRGAIALVASGFGIGVLYRRADGACESGGRSECARFGRARLGEGRPSRGDGYSLPEPCAKALVGAAVAEEIRYHALCAMDEGEPRTMLFGIQFEPRYAHAEPLLAGCEPVGLTPFDEGVALMGDCGDTGARERRGFHVEEAARTIGDLGTPQARCQDGRVILNFGGPELTLGAPRDGLEALLPPAMASGDDRAVWTGEAVLVATQLGRESALRRYGCDRGVFRRTDP